MHQSVLHRSIQDNELTVAQLNAFLEHVRPDNVEGARFKALTEELLESFREATGSSKSGATIRSDIAMQIRQLVVPTKVENDFKVISLLPETWEQMRLRKFEAAAKLSDGIIRPAAAKGRDNSDDANETVSFFLELWEKLEKQAIKQPEKRGALTVKQLNALLRFDPGKTIHDQLASVGEAPTALQEAVIAPLIMSCFGAIFKGDRYPETVREMTASIAYWEKQMDAALSNIRAKGPDGMDEQEKAAMAYTNETLTGLFRTIAANAMQEAQKTAGHSRC